MRTILTLTQHAHVVVYEDIRHHDGKLDGGELARDHGRQREAVLGPRGGHAVVLARRWANTPGATVRALGETVPEAADPAGKDPSAPAEIGSEHLSTRSGMPVLDATR